MDKTNRRDDFSKPPPPFEQPPANICRYPPPLAPSHHLSGQYDVQPPYQHSSQSASLVRATQQQQHSLQYQPWGGNKGRFSNTAGGQQQHGLHYQPPQGQINKIQLNQPPPSSPLNPPKISTQNLVNWPSQTRAQNQSFHKYGVPPSHEDYNHSTRSKFLPPVNPPYSNLHDKSRPPLNFQQNLHLPPPNVKPNLQLDGPITQQQRFCNSPHQNNQFGYPSVAENNSHSSKNVSQNLQPIPSSSFNKIIYQDFNEKFLTFSKPPPIENNLNSFPNINSQSDFHHNKANVCKRQRSESYENNSKSFVSPMPPPVHPRHPNVISHKKDQSFVDAWMKQKVKRTVENNGNAEKKKIRRTVKDVDQSAASEHRQLKLSDVHSSIGRYRTLLQTLRSKSCGADHIISSTDAGETTNNETVAANDCGAAVSTNIIQDDSAMRELEHISQQLLDPEYQESVKKLVFSRRKKRQRHRISKMRRQEEWQKKGDEIDKQRQNIIQNEQQLKKEKSLRLEADTVLREVRGKLQEASNMQLLLSCLKDLRQHRLNKGDNQGYVTTQQHDNRFNKVIDGLDEMVENQLIEYKLEERTVQSMLDMHHGTKQKAPEMKKPPKMCCPQSAVTEILFGCSDPVDSALLASYTAADRSQEMLHSRREAWDRHLTMNSNEGSGVPMSWVLPPSQPGKLWQQWLENT